jgi:hypothetical protein
LQIANAVRETSALPPNMGVKGPLSGVLKSSLGSHTECTQSKSLSSGIANRAMSPSVAQVERVCALQSVMASSKGPNFRIPLNRDNVIVSEDATNHFSSPDLNATATPIRKSDRIRAILSDAVSSIDIIGLYPLRTYFEVYNYRTKY